MLNKLQKRNNRKSDGFTIIEVMIVLAIAALILIIVLFAVPTLQRNSRNTTMKNDASSIVGGITTYESDNNGTPPTVVDGTGSITIATGTTSSPTNPEKIKVNGSTKVSVVTTAPSAAGSTSGQLPIGTIQVVAGASCPTSLGGSGNSAARAFSVYYATETQGGATLQCVDS